MHYTLFELERIERILTAKLEAARDAYEARLRIVRTRFRESLIQEGRISKVSDINMSGNAVGLNGEPVSGVLSDAWEKFQNDDMDLMLLLSEVDLFERGINSLYSYWNYAVEIFIDNMRTKISEKEGT